MTMKFNFDRDNKTLIIGDKLERANKRLTVSESEGQVRFIMIYKSGIVFNGASKKTKSDITTGI